jgi:uncharacterized membrane protein YvbJ
MKKCPYCDEEIQDDAIKCRSCGEMIEDSPQLLSPDSSAKSNGKPISKNNTFLIPIIFARGRATVTNHNNSKRSLKQALKLS